MVTGMPRMTMIGPRSGIVPSNGVPLENDLKASVLESSSLKPAPKPSSADRLADRKNLLLKISIKVLVYMPAVPA